MPALIVQFGAIVAVVTTIAVRPAVAQQQQQQVIVTVTAVPNQVTPGTCTRIVTDVRDEQNRQLMLEGGTPLGWSAFEYASANGTDFEWRSLPSGEAELCAKPGAGAVTTQVTATIRGMPYNGATIVTVASAAAPPISPAAVPTQPYVPPGQPQPAAAAASASPSGASQTAGGVGQGAAGAAAAAPAAGAAGPPSQTAGAAEQSAAGAAAAGAAYAPPGAGAAQGAAGAAAAAPAAGAAGPAYAPSQTAGAAEQNAAGAAAAGPTSAPPAAGAAQGAAGATAAQPAAPPPQTAAQPAAPPPQTAAQPVKSGGGFFKKLGSHIKQRAAEVKAETSQNLTAAATQIVDTTFQTGTKLVASTTAQVTNTARLRIGGVGQKLMLVPQQGGGSSDNLTVAVASGRAVLPEVRFTPGTSVLEPSGRQLVERLGNELRSAMAQLPAVRFEINAHMDSGAGAQVLSEERAAAVKAVLRNYVDEKRITALGFGASQPLAGIPTARIEVVRCNDGQTRCLLEVKP
jgi:outer membrane protein OmpA-like peptidoglycan-associated protein